jgi:hypothetical protein
MCCRFPHSSAHAGSSGTALQQQTFTTLVLVGEGPQQATLRQYLECRHLLDARSRSAFLCGVDHRRNARCCAMIQHPCFQGAGPCRNWTIRESMRWNAYVWKQIACNWQGTSRAPLCSRISFGWRGHGPTERFEDRMRILGRKAHTRTQNRNQRGNLARTRTSRQ